MVYDVMYSCKARIDKETVKKCVQHHFAERICSVTRYLACNDIRLYYIYIRGPQLPF
jgi:hypothetical protein